MRHLSLLLLSLAACGGSSKSTIGNIAGAGGPPGPAPTVAWSGGAPADGDGSFATTGLPAVADDGSRVLYDWQQGDGGRGYPNLRLVTVDRADQVIDTRVVLDVEAVEGTSVVETASHNQFLADSNQKLRWRPLPAAPVEGEPAGDDMFPSRHTSTLGPLTVALDDEAHLVITSDGKVVVDKVMSGWLVANRPMYEGAAEDEMCSNPIYLGSVHADPARHVVLIGVEYRGNDSCWEPTGQLHAVTW